MIKQIKPHLNILFADLDDNIAVILLEEIKNKYEEKYDLNFNISHKSEQILEYAENERIDIFILILNNIYFSPADSNALERIKKSVNLIALLKSKYRNPIIALCGDNTKSIHKRAMLAGTDFYFLMPCKLDLLREAFEKCLTRSSGLL